VLPDFLHKAIQVIERRIMDEGFNIDEFASEMNVSKTVLHRKFKLLMGERPTPLSPQSRRLAPQQQPHGGRNRLSDKLQPIALFHQMFLERIQRDSQKIQGAEEPVI